MTEFLETQSFDFNGYLGRKADGTVWYIPINRSPCDRRAPYQISAHLWKADEHFFDAHREQLCMPAASEVRS